MKKADKNDLGDCIYEDVIGPDGSVTKAIVEREYVPRWIRKKYHVGEFMDPEAREIHEYEYGTSKPITDEFIAKKRKCYERLDAERNYEKLIDAEFKKLDKVFITDSREGHDETIDINGIGKVRASRLKGWAFYSDTPEDKQEIPENIVWVDWKLEDGQLKIIIGE